MSHIRLGLTTKVTPWKKKKKKEKGIFSEHKYPSVRVTFQPKMAAQALGLVSKALGLQITDSADSASTKY